MVYSEKLVILGEDGEIGPETNSQDFAQPCLLLKGKRRNNFNQSLEYEIKFIISPLHADLLIFPNLSLDALLLGGPHAIVCSLTCTAHLCPQNPLANLLREELGAENHCLSTYFFILTHFNQGKESKVRQGFVDIH